MLMAAMLGLATMQTFVCAVPKAKCAESCVSITHGGIHSSNSIIQYAFDKKRPLHLSNISSINRFES